ncbi:MAG: hypothetical protein HFH93_13860 [Lachnospiraceae bacterium]|nr:hypothetical protein [Lachnospiraceae bacterium]
MRRWISRWMRAAIVCCMVLSLTACGFGGANAWEWLTVADNVAGVLGASQITADEDLLGERVCHDEAYVGDYEARCLDTTGRDVIFGGGSIEPRRLQVYGRIRTEAGEAAVRIRMNDEVVTLETDEEGYFETELRLKSGGNYIMVDYEAFSGTVELISIRLPLDWDGKDALAKNILVYYDRSVPDRGWAA